MLPVSSLKENRVDFDHIECDDDLLASFEDLFISTNFLHQPIIDLCKKHWNEVEGKESEYNFDGTRHP